MLSQSNPRQEAAVDMETFGTNVRSNVQVACGRHRLSASVRGYCHLMEIQEPYSKTLMDRDDPSQSDAQPKKCVTDSITLGDGYLVV